MIYTAPVNTVLPQFTSLCVAPLARLPHTDTFELNFDFYNQQQIDCALTGFYITALAVTGL
jgi:hypothetical protein